MWRLLEEGERPMEGDQWWYQTEDVIGGYWTPANGPYCQMDPYEIVVRRKIKEWIDVKNRLPKSGVPVIVFVVVGDKTRRLRALYAARHTLELGDDQEPWGDDCYDEETDTYFCPEGWYEYNEFEDTHWHIDGTVTHWMPLPDPPTTSKNRDLGA